MKEEGTHLSIRSRFRSEQMPWGDLRWQGERTDRGAGGAHRAGRVTQRQGFRPREVAWSIMSIRVPTECPTKDPFLRRSLTEVTTRQKEPGRGWRHPEISDPGKPLFLSQKG